jgi:alpha-tubulin suppressor-like RCC1 family protein
VQCWGYNGYGTLGDGTETDRATPGPFVANLGNVTAVTVGYLHACALAGNGSVQCWGANPYGQLGNGTRADASTPVKVKGLSGASTAVVAGDGHTCALLQRGQVACWGLNEDGQLGVTGSDRSGAIAVRGLAGPASAIAAGGNTTCALLVDASVQCWGAGSYGQLGNGGTTDSSAPVTVQGLTALAIGVGYRHACAITRTGELRCWGDNANGDLGNGSRTQSATPVEVTGVSGTATDVVSGAGTSCALIDGGAACWGNNAYGQLGTNAYDYADEPLAIDGAAEGLTTLSLSGFTICAVAKGGGSLASGGILCWGADDSGQLGNGNIAQALSPGDVPGYP